MKKIVLINGHPKKDSFTAALVGEYKRGALEAGAEVREIVVTDLPIERYLRYEHFTKQPVGEDILHAREDIAWAEHIVFVHPVWWAGMPALLKCFVDMVFSAGFAFRYTGKSPFPLKLLKGRTAHIITTLDTPPFVYRFLFGAPSVNQLKSRVLAFCGIAPTCVTYLGPIRSSTTEKRAQFLARVYLLGTRLQ